MMIDNTRTMHSRERLEDDAVEALRYVPTRDGLLSEVGAPGAAVATG